MLCIPVVSLALFAMIRVSHSWLVPVPTATEDVAVIQSIFVICNPVPDPELVVDQVPDPGDGPGLATVPLRQLPALTTSICVGTPPVAAVTTPTGGFRQATLFAEAIMFTVSLTA